MQTGYPPIRRVVTGHDEAGVAKVLLDAAATNAKYPQAGLVSTMMWCTDGAPAAIPIGEQPEDAVGEADQRDEHDQHRDDVGEKDDAVACPLCDRVHRADRRVVHDERRRSRRVGAEWHHQRRDCQRAGWNAHW